MQGVTQVTVNVAGASTEAWFMSLLNTATTDAFVGTASVGPGLVVRGDVFDTRGRLVSAVVPAVMKCDTNGVTSGRPPALIVAFAVTV
jgi:hypothetical protein